MARITDLEATPMTRIVTIAACLTLAAAAAAGCGSSSKKSTTTAGGGATTTPAAAPATAAGGAEVTVSMKQIKFVPENIKAKVGQTIKWTNDDPFAHTVTAKSGATFDSGPVAAGATYKFTPTKAGTINYVCTIHQGQKGTITVTP
jgi:plastocyanin